MEHQEKSEQCVCDTAVESAAVGGLVPDFKRDVSEAYVRRQMPEVLDELLRDHTTGKNIMWGTKDYEWRGAGFGEWDEIKAELIAGEEKVIVPRACKSKEEQKRRIREKGEVFTPAWICNAMINLLDNTWFDRKNAGFNQELDKEKKWVAIKKPLSFPKSLKKDWREYVMEVRLEITCGEAPFVVSRYDMAELAYKGGLIPIDERIGMLDRKLRIITENCKDRNEWLKWAEVALESVLAYEWQGDNVFLARQNVLWTVLETFYEKFDGAIVPPEKVRRFAEIVSWNVWQMDGLKFVVPNSCHSIPVPPKPATPEQPDLFAAAATPPKRKVKPQPTELPCPGCAKKKPLDGVNLHNGIYCLIMDWENEEPYEFRWHYNEGVKKEEARRRAKEEDEAQCKALK